MRKSHAHGRSGASMVETVVTTAISAVAIGALYVGSTAVQKSFKAAQHYAESQEAQLRIIDYLGRDLRSATGWPTVSTKEITLDIPNYYDRSNPDRPKPTTPKVGEGGAIYYGTSAQDKVRVRYYTTETPGAGGRKLVDVHRSVTSSGITDDQVIVSGADTFEITFDPSDSKKQIVRAKITFPPMFRPFVDSGDVFRDGTATHASILVRNKR